MSTLFFSISLFSLFGIIFLTLNVQSINRIGLIGAKELLEKKRTFLFYPLLKKYLSYDIWDNFNRIISLTSRLLHLLFAFSFFLFLVSEIPDHQREGLEISLLISATIAFLLIVLIYLLCSIIATVLGKESFLFSSPFVYIYIILFFPITGPLLAIRKKISHYKPSQPTRTHLIKEKVQSLIEDIGLYRLLTPIEQRLLTSFLTFHDIVAREVMIPRVNVVSIPATSTVGYALKVFNEEEYSRIPVYGENLDHILGLLMYKDLMKFVSDSEDPKATAEVLVKTLIKPVIYAPENKKISGLFQEFRLKQTHMAIIVNEYGGTEGIITIEDILEELVGEIEDEYDIQEEPQFWKLPSGCWVVDAKMSIIDIENKLGIQIPHHPEYETIGGFVFHRAGTIPSKGWTLSLDEYKLEVLISNERCIEKIRILPVAARK